MNRQAVAILPRRELERVAWLQACKRFAIVLRRGMNEALCRKGREREQENEEKKRRAEHR